MVFRNRQKTIRVADVLHGCTPGRIQSVGYMQVIPLVSELSDDRFVSPVEGEAEVFTTNYGSLGFRIYNNWGELIFESFDQMNGWDGTYNGIEQPVGVYVYTVRAVTEDDEVHELSGDVTLLR